MKNITIIAFIFISFGAFAQTPDEIFTEANTLYKQQKYSEALKKYEDIIETGYQSEDLFFNIANTYYKLEETAPAILFYKRALKLNPNLDDAVFNLKMAQLRTVDKFEKLPETFFMEFWNWVTKILTVHQWSVFAVLLSFASATGFILYFFANTSIIKRLSFVISITSAFIMIISIVIAYQQDTWQNTHKEAVIMSENSYIKVAPNQNSDDSFILHEGTEVLIVDQVDEWLRIKLVDGKIGWIHSGDISIV